ncbi:MAG: GH32 C-terminal domain-containing protein [Phycisphaerales bacterium]|nr:MAG: GH32 C-terminal domain-containing protein [Phycisphaerales bacterium]
MRRWIQIVVLLLIAGRSGAQEDVLIADFEGSTYGDWTVTGQAFGSGPARGTLPNQMQVSGFEGRGLVNSYHGGDDTTGTLTSPPFTISRRYINFLIGGGKYAGKTCMNLVVGEKVVRTATGPNDEPGGSEALAWQSWDVADLAGRTAQIQIVDQKTGGWGHINVDHILQSNEEVVSERSRDMVFTKRYLHLPVKNGAAKRRMSVIINGETMREFEIELADAEPDFWVFLDVSGYRGKQATLRVNAPGRDSQGLAAITQGDEIRGVENLYREKHRQQFHFSSRRGWNNDSNGLVFYKGEYHLYYQHNPYGWNWGNMHWGHAVSTDLVHWKELPIAIYPHRFGDWVFSGSAVVDWNNTAGFKKGTEDVIVAAYTSTGRGECIAYSLDRGRTFTDYEGDPVVKHRGRDPKVIWYKPGGHWVMALYSEIDEKRTIAFYTSPDLKDWTYQSHIDGFYECPEIFELPLDGNQNNTRWVVYAADGNYMIGRFDGKTFTPESDKLQGNYGNCFYASQTYSDIPAEDGRRIQVAWGRIATPGMPFNQCMLFPCVLRLVTTDEGIRMFAEPIKEIELLHKKEYHWHNVALRPAENILSNLSGDLFHIESTFDVRSADRVGFVIRGVEISYDVGRRTLSCLDKSAPLQAPGGRIHLEILVDRTSMEIFANGGRIYMPMGIIPADEDRSLQVFGQGRDPRLAALGVYELDSAWNSGH